MADTGSSEPPFSTMEDESMVSFTTLLLALVTLAVYLFFLKPTAGDGNDNANNNNNRNRNRNATTNTTSSNTTGTATRERQRHRGGGRRQIPQQQQPAHRRRLQMSENAMEILRNCQSLPPHVVSSSSASASSSSNSSKRTIGGSDILSENGLVVFSHTRAASSVEASGSSSRSQTPKGSSANSAINVDAPATVTMDRASSESNNNDKTVTVASASLLQRKERAKILSRLFAATLHHHHAAAKGGLPPSKGSTFVIGISRETHLLDRGQRSSLLRAIKGLAAHYTVLVVVSVAPKAAANSSYEHQYESTQALHSEAICLLRGHSSSNSNGDESKGDYELSEAVLPSHRVLLAGLAKGRVALVRQLSTNIGLTVDFDRDVREELERFGYVVSIVEDWTSILPANGNSKEAAKL